MLPHPKICILPWISVETTPTGTMRACCLSTEELVHERQVMTVDQGLSAAYNSDSMRWLRQQFVDGQQPGNCQRCWTEEDSGRTSKRQWHLRKFAQQTAKIRWYDKHPGQLWFLDLKLGNICNLKCRICGTWSSSKWAQEEIDYQTIDNPKTTRAYQQLKQGEWPRRAKSFWQDLATLLPQIQYFEFTGGEPFLIKEHMELLEQAAMLDVAKNISVHYNTNGTTWDEQLVRVWQNFKAVEIAFSIDNIGERFELERKGANWQQVMDNLHKALLLRQQANNIKLQVCITINIQNVYYFDELSNWAMAQGFDMVYVNMLHDPPHMNVANMTDAAKSLVLNKLRSSQVHPRMYNEVQGIIRFIENGAGSDGTAFCQYMQRTDANRQENFADTHAVIAKAMGYAAT